MKTIKIKKEEKALNQDAGNKEILKKGSGKKGKEEGQTRSSIYKGMDALSMKDQKKERSKIRRKLDAFCNDAFGKDRSKEEKENAIKSFDAFYKKNWKIQNYQVDSFSNQSDKEKREQFTQLLDLAKKLKG